MGLSVQQVQELLAHPETGTYLAGGGHLMHYAANNIVLVTSDIVKGSFGQIKKSNSLLTTDPGSPLRPSVPGFPGTPWGPTGPVFPGGPTAPGSPCK